MEQLNKAFHAQNLTFGYNSTSILENITIHIDYKKLTFVLGQNGSGKSTFIKILAGLLPQYTGMLKIADQNSTAFSNSERAKWTGFLNQHHKAVFPFTVEDVVLTGRAGFIGFTPNKMDKQATIEALEKINIIHLRNRNYTELSGGEQQLVMIARLLAQNPKILLLDEPTSHLDFNNQSHLLHILRQLVSDGLTIVAIIHDPNLAFMYGDDFLFVKDKKVFRTNQTINAWDIEFLKTIYHNNIQSIPFNGRALLVPIVNN